MTAHVRVLLGSLVAGALVVGAVVPAAQAAPSSLRVIPTTATAVPSIDTSNRSAVADAFRKYWIPSVETPVTWTGSLKGCHPGTNSVGTLAAVTRATNVMRAMAGLPNVTYDDSHSSAELQAALVMQANGKLSHSPRANGLTKCLTDDADTAAGMSNLELGWVPPGLSSIWRSGWGGDGAGQTILDYMTDDGSSNHEVGHRRWLLWEQLTSISSGTTSAANAVSVLGALDRYQQAVADAQSNGTPPPQNTGWTSWPTAGWFPSQFEPQGRWSLSAPALDSGYDFTHATVAVRRNGTPIATHVYPPQQGYGDDTLVWQMATPHRPSGRAVDVYSVTVAGIVGADGQSLTKSYDVRLFNGWNGRSPAKVVLKAKSAGDGTVIWGWNLHVRGGDSAPGRRPWTLLVDGKKTAHGGSAMTTGFIPLRPGRHRLTLQFSGTATESPAHATTVVKVSRSGKPGTTRLTLGLD